MDPNATRLDLSTVDPVDVVMLVARKAGVAAPDDARAWLAAPGRAPRRRSAPYVAFLTELRRADVSEIFRDALEVALASARGDIRLADLLDQTTPATSAPSGPAADTGDDRDDVEQTGPTADGRDDADGAAPPDEASDDWYEAPADDAIGVLLAVARRAGVAVPDGARAWLSAPPPAPFDESWAYRRMLTTLPLAPVPTDVRAAIDDALAGARSGSGRLAELLGAHAPDATEQQGDPAGPGSPDRHRHDPGPGDLHVRHGRARPRPSRHRRPRLRYIRPRWRCTRTIGWARNWRRWLAVAALAVAVGAAAAWAVLQVAPELRHHLPALGLRQAFSGEPQDDGRPSGRFETDLDLLTDGADTDDAGVGIADDVVTREFGELPRAADVSAASDHEDPVTGDDDRHDLRSPLRHQVSDGAGLDGLRPIQPTPHA